MFNRIVGGAGANFFGLCITLGIQILSMPVFLSCWPVEKYGLWVLLSAVPVYFSMVDLGIVGVAINKMTIAKARGDSNGANSVFQSALFLTVLLILAIGFISVVIIFSINDSENVFIKNRGAMTCLIFCSLLGVFSGLFDAVYRASGFFAVGVCWVNGIRFFEWVGGLIGLLMFGSYLSVSIGMLVSRAVLSVYLISRCSLLFKEFKWGFSSAKIYQIKEMLIPALSFMLFPLGNAMSIQGMTIIVGTMLGSKEVVVYSAIRTVSRVVVQLIATVNRSLWPEFSRAYGLGGWSEIERLYKVGLLISLFLAILVGCGVFAFSAQIFSYWSGGALVVDHQLLAVMLLSCIITSFYQVGMVFISSINKHKRLSLYSVMSYAMALLLGYVGVTCCGLLGATLAVFVGELFIAFFVALEVKRIFRSFI